MNSVLINVCGIFAFLAVTTSQENCELRKSILAPFKFKYKGDTNFLNVDVKLKTWTSDVSYSEIYETGEIKTKKQIAKRVKCQKDGKEKSQKDDKEKCQKDAKEHRFKFSYYKINKTLDIVSIYLAVKTAQECSKNITILEGTHVPSYERDTNNDCLKPCPCTIEVDLEHACKRYLEHADSVSETFQTEATTTTANAPISEEITNNEQRHVLIYVILSVIVTCVIILVIYIIVKKYCHRKLQADGTMELNTYATATELVYADLSFVHGASQLPRCGEEATYAEIVGVLKPADSNVKSK